MSKAIVLHTGWGERALAGYLGYGVGRALSSGIDSWNTAKPLPSGPSGLTAAVVWASF